MKTRSMIGVIRMSSLVSLRLCCRDVDFHRSVDMCRVRRQMRVRG
jgi:hypothetical protein